MYIRRKVFSVLADEMGEERLYSVNETFFEGYEYDEVDDRMFSISKGGNAVTITEIKEAYNNAGGKKSGKSFKDFSKEFLGRVDDRAAKREAKRVARREANKLNPTGVIVKNTKMPAGAAKAIEDAAFARGKDAAFAHGKASATLKDAAVNTWKNAGKLGKAGMVLVPAAALGGAVALGRASKKD